MSKVLKYFCDMCEVEFPPNKAYAFLAGQNISVDKELKMYTVPFEGHYCGDCAEAIIKSIHEMRVAKDAEKVEKK